MTERERQQQQQIALLVEENRLLRQRVDLLVRQIYGSKSEKLDPAQLELLLEGLDASGKPEASGGGEEAPEAEKPSGSKRGKRQRRQRIPDHLPVVEKVVDPEPVKACPQAWKCIGEERSEQLDYEPGHFFKRVLVRRKYVRKADKESPPVIAPLPGKLIEGGVAAPGLLAHIAVSRYCDHLPFYRQEGIYTHRYEVPIARQSMSRWMDQTAFWLKPIYELIKWKLLAGDYLQVDETPVKYLAPGTGRAPKGYFWTIGRPGGDVIFDWHAGRGAECLDSLLGTDYAGILQSDAYKVYRTYAEDNSEVTWAACWAHARRKFEYALEENPRLAAWMLRQIGHLYAVERNLREKMKAGPALRQAVRWHESKPLYKRIGRALVTLQAKKSTLPKSRLGEAIDYTLGIWKQLGVFLEHGRIEIDNNHIENAIRPTAVGKKNWLFIGAEEAGQRSAILFSIIECCRRRGIDPYAYLKDVLTRIPSMKNHEVASLTPEAWAQAREDQSLPAAA